MILFLINVCPEFAHATWFLYAASANCAGQWFRVEIIFIVGSRGITKVRTSFYVAVYTRAVRDVNRLVKIEA